MRGGFGAEACLHLVQDIGQELKLIFIKEMLNLLTLIHLNNLKFILFPH